MGYTAIPFPNPSFFKENIPRCLFWGSWKCEMHSVLLSQEANAAHGLCQSLWSKETRHRGMMVTTMTLELWNERQKSCPSTPGSWKEEGRMGNENYWRSLWLLWSFSAGPKAEENLLWRLHLSQLSPIPCACLQQTDSRFTAYIHSLYPQEHLKRRPRETHADL